MSLADQINNDIKAAMLAREKEKLEALRAIKAALLLAASEKGAGGQVSDEGAIKVLQKLVKQRTEAAGIYAQQGREDLAAVERAQSAVIATYLPAQLSEEEVRAALQKIIAETGASGPQDMGKVMGPAMKQLSGKADGKLVSALVKELLAGK